MLVKIVAQFLLPLNLAIELWLLAGLLRWRGRRRLARVFGTTGFLVLLVSSLPVFAKPLVRSLESQYPILRVEDSPTADAIVVLGGGLGSALPPRTSADLEDGADRVLHGARLYRAGKAPLVVASGGTLVASRPTEAPAMAALLEEWGVPASAILQETASGTTQGNAEETKRELAARGAKRILLVTSALHMPRAMAVFRKTGLEVIASPTDVEVVDGDSMGVLDWLPDTGALDLTTRALHEWLGRRYYDLRGWTAD